MGSVFTHLIHLQPLPHFKTFRIIGEKIMSEETKEKIGEIIGGIVFGSLGWAILYQYLFIGG